MTVLEIPLVDAVEFKIVAEITAHEFGQAVVDHVFSDYRFPKSILSNPSLRLPNGAYAEFLEACARSAGQPLFGAMIGSRIPFSELGTFGAYCAQAETLDTALHRMSRGLKYHETGSSFVCVPKGPRHLVTYVPPTPRAFGAWQQSDGTAAMIINLIRTYEGAAWSPEHISLAGAQGDRRKLLEDYFGISVDERDIGLELTCRFDRLLEPRIEQLTVDKTVSFAELRVMVRKRPSSAFEVVLKEILSVLIQDRRLNLSSISEKIGVSVRTLQRRLFSAGTSFDEIMKDVRFEIASDLLANTKLNNKEVSEKLGFSSRQNFVRAFKNWTGKTPDAFRRQY
jgi:AraC-like DNA-binding protein